MPFWKWYMTTCLPPLPPPGTTRHYRLWCTAAGVVYCPTRKSLKLSEHSGKRRFGNWRQAAFAENHSWVTYPFQESLTARPDSKAFHRTPRGKDSRRVLRQRRPPAKEPLRFELPSAGDLLLTTKPRDDAWCSPHKYRPRSSQSGHLPGRHNLR